MTESQATIRSTLVASALVLGALLAPTHGVAGEAPTQLLVRFRPGASLAGRSALDAAAGTRAVETFSSVDGLQLIELAPGRSLANALAEYGSSPDVLYVEPNRPLRLEAGSDDPGFVDGDLWNLNMYPIFDDADVDAPEAWDVSTGSRDVVVAIVDTGLDYTHEDLAANVFRNEAECDGDGIDDDHNGWVDDCHGIDPADGDSDPMDVDLHGTHVAGTIGAVGNNGTGVVGVNWRVSLLPCKVFDSNGDGSLAAALVCLDYIAALKARGVNVVASNNSWSIREFSQSLHDAIEAQRQQGILFVAAAGNYDHCSFGEYDCRLDTDNDRKPTYPASYWLPNVLSVANSINYGWLNAGSGRGRRTVHVAAPGSWILSTVPGNGYDYLTGTSMATPHVAGLAALLEAANPARDWKAIRNLILAGAEGDMFPDDGSLVTDARLNARGAVTCANQTVTSRLRPVQDAVTAVVGQPLELAVLHIRCAAPDGNVTVTVTPGGQTITLRDDGANGDQEAGDGTYSGRFTPVAQGHFALGFPGGDVVGVDVLAGSYGVAAVPNAWRTITGTPLQILPLEQGVVTSPFPLRFGGGSYTTLYVDERGALQFDGGGTYHDLSPYNEPMPSPFHSTLLAPFWDQVKEQPLADIVWEVTGTAPNRELVVEWRDMERSDYFCAIYDGYVTFQVVFFEGSSDVLFNYADTTVGFDCPFLDAGASATVGMQVTPDVATVFGFNAPVLVDGMSLLWTLGGPVPPQPVIGVTPASVDFGNVAVGTTSDLTFSVQNTGTGTLTGQASAAAPFAVVSGGTYSLPAGQSQEVTVRFSPTAAGTSNGTVTFTGAAGAARPVRGVGTDATAAACGREPRHDCNAPASKATLKLTRNYLVAGRDKLLWQWQGAGAGAADFGDPRVGTRYDLCIYDGTALVASFSVSAGALWRGSSSGFEFRDQQGLQHGITSVKLQSSVAPGPAKVQVKADGPNLDGWMPKLPMVQPTVQLVASDGACWSGTGTTPPTRNTDRSLNDRCSGTRNPCTRPPL